MYAQTAAESTVSKCILLSVHLLEGHFIKETLIKAFSPPDLRCEAVFPLQIRAIHRRFLRKG